MSVPSYPHLLTGWTFVRVSACLWRAAEHATPKYDCRSWGHATAKCAALAYYLELWVLENQQMQGQVCSELSYRNSAVINPLPGVWSTRWDDSCHRKGEEKSIPCLDSLSCRLSHLSSIFLRAISSVQFSSVVQSCPTLRPHEPQHARPPCPSPTPGVHPNPCLLSWWYHPTISSSIVSFSSCPQSLPASGSFQMSQLFASSGQSTGVSASTSVLPMNTQDWSPLGWTGWISLQTKGLSRVFSNTTVQRHQFFCAQLSL